MSFCTRPPFRAGSGSRMSMSCPESIIIVERNGVSRVVIMSVVRDHASARRGRRPLRLSYFRMATYFFSSPVDVDIKLEGEDVRKQIESKAEKDRPVSCPVYYDGEGVAGQVRHAHTCLFASFVPVVLTENDGRSQSAFEMANALHTKESKSSLWET
jgi:Vacuolar protein sorting-associated protein 26